MTDTNWPTGGGPFIRLCNSNINETVNSNDSENTTKVKKNMFTINNILSKRKLSNTKRVTNKIKENINIVNKKVDIDITFNDSNLLDYISDLKVK